jgi:putative CocE/NonD family hydrolase
VTTSVGEVSVPWRFNDYRTESIYVTMRDGVRIAIDITLPYPLASGERIPAILEMTRYWRAIVGNGIGWRVAYAASRGYAFVTMDERGTGASFGSWPSPWSEEALTDCREIVDWILAQPWSNGRVGTFGISYPGMSAQMITTVNHPAVRAAIPAFTQYDVYADISFPGGIHNDWFMSSWSEIVLGMDRNEWPFDPNASVKAVDVDVDGLMRDSAIAEHSNNGDVYFDGTAQATYRDDVTVLGMPMEELGAHGKRDEIEQSDAAIYSWGSWVDHSTAHSVITRFLTLGNPQQAVIGPWRHGGGGHGSPYQTPGTAPQPAEEDQWRESLNFLDEYLMEDGSGVTERVLYYYTLGSEEWNSTTVWPVDGMMRESWYFGAGNTLSTSMPTGQDGRDSYAIDFTATTGYQTRWHTALDSSVVYRDRRNEDEKLLTYTSAPLTEDTEITGYPVVTLHVASTHTDGAFYGYLEDVDPSGYVTYVTEGQLRALHRKVSGETPPYELLIPYHTFKQADGQPLVPGEISEITFGLQPTSVLIRAGHRIRVAIAGHDADLFERYPATGDPVVTVERNSVYPSGIELPVVRR